MQRSWFFALSVSVTVAACLAGMAFAAWNLEVVICQTCFYSVLFSTPLGSVLIALLHELICYKMPGVRFWKVGSFTFGLSATLTANVVIVVLDQADVDVFLQTRAFVATFVYTLCVNLGVHIVHETGAIARAAVHSSIKWARSHLKSPGTPKLRLVHRLDEVVPAGAECIICLECLDDLDIDLRPPPQWPPQPSAHGSLCLPDSGLVKFPCNHCFHASCIGRWLTSGAERCPTCRTFTGCENGWECIFLTDTKKAAAADCKGALPDDGPAFDPPSQASTFDALPRDGVAFDPSSQTLTFDTLPDDCPDFDPTSSLTSSVYI